MNQENETTNCPECNEEVELCISCGEIVHDDDPKALTGGGTYCGFCHKKQFLEGCTNRKTAQDIDGHPV
jgi:hypothetical protein